MLLVSGFRERHERGGDPSSILLYLGNLPSPPCFAIFSFATTDEEGFSPFIKDLENPTTLVPPHMTNETGGFSPQPNNVSLFWSDLFHTFLSFTFFGEGRLRFVRFLRPRQVFDPQGFNGGEPSTFWKPSR